ncbi:glycosyltransferase [Sphingomonas sp. HF-S3]|uniref:Glycosyltransferase n=1 Tax=Sphingomonas rustica TaxID=3103142 RepID=A0ABV0B952_9SPHN
MRILHIAQIVKGGTAAHLCEVMPWQIERWGADNVTLLAAADQLDHLRALPRDRIRTFPSARRSPGQLIAMTRAARRLIRQQRPDIVHLHGTFAGAMIRLSYLFKRRGRPIIVYCSHGWSFNMQVRPSARFAYTAVERLLAPVAASIPCISHYEVRTAVERGLPQDKLVLIYNGVADIATGQQEAPVPRGEHVNLLFMARPGPQKGFDTLVDAMRLVEDRPLVLHAVGPDVDPDTLGPNIVQHGWQPRSRIPDFIAACDAVVVPSRWEGFGLVVIEAMRQARAVLASTADALPELVEDGKTGHLFAPDDAPALARLLSGLEPGALAEFGRAGRDKFLERFTSDRMNLALAALYSDLVSRRGGV